MKIMVTDKLDGTLAVINADYVNYDPEEKEAYLNTADGGTFIIEGMDRYDYERFAKQ